jgi:hypothetical protein
VAGFEVSTEGVNEHANDNALPPYQLIEGEGLAALATLPSDSVDCIATDPPYSSGGLHSPRTPAGALYFKNHDLAIDEPTDNCIGIIDHAGGLGHTLFIETAGDTCHTIEGNTDPLGGREGYIMAERDRPRADITYFLRIG